MGAKKLKVDVDLDKLRVFTFKDFGERIGVGKRHVERMVRDKKIPAEAVVRVNGKRRITYAGLVNFLKTNTEGDLGLG